MRAEDPKEILQRARYIQRRIDQRQAELTRVREMRSYITGTNFEAVRVKHSADRGPTERLALSSRVEALEEMLRADVEKLAEAKIEAIGLISLLENPWWQEVLWVYYIRSAKNWGEAAEIVGYSEQHAKRIHGLALREIRRKMRLNEPI